VLSYLFLSLFSSYSFYLLLDLPSFPTRRSSDLVEYPDYPYRPIPDAQMMEFQFLRVYNTFMYRYKDTRFFMGLGYHLDIHQNIRSEEHTSELQSRENLVCRLLLEKKKLNNYHVI